MNILNIIETEGLQIKKVGAEYQGPCPFCKDGTDRFHIHPDKGEHGTYWCRVCGRKGDAIQFLRDYKDMGYRAACEYMGKTPKEVERKSKGPRTPGNPSTGSERTLEYEPRVCKAPEEIWSERAEALVEWAQGIMFSGQGLVVGGQLTPIQWLAARGITLYTATRFRLGWNPGENGKDIYRSRESWGLPKELKENGKEKKVWVPIGLTIPLIQNGKVIRVRIRREVSAEAENRYIPIPGGSSAPLVIPALVKEGCPKGGVVGWVIVESELDAILIAQEVGDIVGVIALGNNCAALDIETYNSVKGSLCILNSLDYDQGGTSQVRKWAENFPQAERWPVPTGKDPGDYYKGGGNIREWIMAGLPPVFKISGQGSVASGQLNSLNRSPTTDHRPLLSHVIEAADGRRVYITDDRAEYKRLQREKKIVFNSEELALVRPEAAGIAMDAKEIWRRAEVVTNHPCPSLTKEGNSGNTVLIPRLTKEGCPQGGVVVEPTQGGLF